MTIAINSKSLVIDCNDLRPHATLTNPEEATVKMTVQGQYVVRMTCYDFMGKTSTVPKVFSASDEWVAFLGTAGAPLITIDDSAFNDSNDWTDASPAAGKICVKVSLNNENLLDDISGLASKDYLLQVWCVPVTTEDPYLVASIGVPINNVAVEVPVV